MHTMLGIHKAIKWLDDWLLKFCEIMHEPFSIMDHTQVKTEFGKEGRNNESEDFVQICCLSHLLNSE